MAIQSHLISTSFSVTSMNSDSDGHASGTDDDERSDTSSEITELDPAEIPGLFREHNGRLFHSHGGSPYPLPVDTAETNVSNVICSPSSIKTCSTLGFAVNSPCFGQSKTLTRIIVP